MPHEAGRWGVVEQGHLGGYIPGGDPDTTYPELWRWLVQELDCRSIVDVGCGDGVAIDAFVKAGATNVVGIDGVSQEHALIERHDYTQGPWARGRFDLCWCCEFVEHVEEEYIPNFLSTFQTAEIVLLTHALPEQKGWHHVNCQDQVYWIERVCAAGFSYDLTLTVGTRERAHGYYAKTGLAFRNLFW